MGKISIFMIVLLLTPFSLYAEIYGKVAKIKKDRGNLNIEVVYYNNKAEIEKCSFLIADNENAESELKRIVCAQIKEIQEQKAQVTKPQPAEKVHAKIKVGDEIRLPVEGKKTKNTKPKTKK